MIFSKQALVTAVGALVDLDDDTAERYGSTIESMARFRVRNPDAWLGYDLEVFNPLVELAGADPDGFAGVQELVDKQRRARGAKPAWPDKSDEGFDKVEYQRLLMQERRRRAGRAVEIENLQRPEKDRLVGTKRLEFENRTLARWGAQLQAILDEERAEFGGSIPRVQQRQIREKFWAGIDRHLDELEKSARRKRIG